MTVNTGTRRLYKSRTDRMLDGICGGVAEFFGLDSTLVRIAWVLTALFGGFGILLYILAMIIMPSNPHTDQVAVPAPTSREKNSRFWGILLIVVGTVWFLGNIGWPIWHHWWGLAWDIFLPVLLILAGVAFLFGGRNSIAGGPVFQGPAAPPGAEPGVRSAPAARLFKSRTERKMFGVCGGIATYFQIDPTLVRLLFVIAAFASFGFMILMYIIMAIVVPAEPAIARS